MNIPAKKIDQAIDAFSTMILRLRAYKKIALNDTSPNAQEAWRAVSDACDCIERAMEEMGEAANKAKKEENPLSVVPG